MAYHMYKTPGTKSDLEKALETTGSTAASTAAAKSAAAGQTSSQAAAKTDATQSESSLLRSEKPTYAGTYDSRLQELYDKVSNLPDFNYNINEDALFAQYRDSYTQSGRKAMEDAMGQAASLTGGYGSSYSQAAGQQAYGDYLQKLHDIVPTLEQRAYDRYRQGYDDLLDQYSLTWQQAEREYEQYLNDLSQYQKDTADAYDRLQQLITTTGYTPTAQELADANMTESQAQAFGKYYTAQNTPKYTTSGKGSSDTSADPYVDLKSLNFDGYPDLQAELVGTYKAKGEAALLDKLQNWTAMGYINRAAADIMYSWVMNGGHLTLEQEAQAREEERKDALSNAVGHVLDFLTDLL